MVRWSQSLTSSLLFLFGNVCVLHALSVPSSLSAGGTLRLKGGGSALRGVSIVADARRFGKGGEEFPDESQGDRRAKAKAEEEKKAQAAKQAAKVKPGQQAAPEDGLMQKLGGVWAGVSAGAVTGYQVVSDSTVAGWNTLQEVSKDGAAKVGEGAAVVADLAKEGAAKAGDLAKEGYSKGMEFYDEHPHEVQSAGAAILVLALIKAVLSGPATSPAPAVQGKSSSTMGTKVASYTKKSVAYTSDKVAGATSWLFDLTAPLTSAVKNTTASASSGIKQSASAVGGAASAAGSKVANASKVVGGKVVDASKVVGGKVAGASKTVGGKVANASKALGSSVKVASRDAANLVISSTADASKSFWSSALACFGFTQGTVGVRPINCTVVSGSVDSGNFVVELKQRTRVGGAVVRNKLVQTKGKGDQAKKIKTGTFDFTMEVSEDKKTWTPLHSGWLRYGATAGGYQYVSFRAKWAKFMRFSTVSSYKGGPGLRGIGLHRPSGAAGFHMLWHQTDVVHSFLDARAPGMWDTVTVPDIHKTAKGQKNWTEVAMRVPIGVGRLSGFDTPDDLGLPKLRGKTKELGMAVGETAKSTAQSTVQALKPVGLAVANGTKSVAQGLSKAGNATKRVAINVGQTTGKVAGNVTAAATRVVHNVSAAAGRASKSTGKALNNVTLATRRAIRNINVTQRTDNVRQWWRRNVLRRSETELAKGEDGGPGCLPITSLLLVAGGVTASQVYPEETEKLLQELKERAEPITTPVVDKAKDLWSKAQEMAGTKEEAPKKKGIF